MGFGLAEMIRAPGELGYHAGEAYVREHDASSLPGFFRQAQSARDACGQGELAGQGREAVVDLVGEIALGAPLGRQRRDVRLCRGLAPRTRRGAVVVHHRPQGGAEALAAS